MVEGQLKTLGEGKGAVEAWLKEDLERLKGKLKEPRNWTYAASTCTGNRGLKSRLSLPAMSLRRHW